MHPTAPRHGVRGNIERPDRVAALRTVLVPVLVLVVRFPHFTKKSLKQNSGAWSQVQAAGDGHSGAHDTTPPTHGVKMQTCPAGQAGFAAEQLPSWIFELMVHANPGPGTLARQEHVLSNGAVQGAEGVHWPLWPLQTCPDGQMPQLPPQPSGPHCLPWHRGVQTHVPS
jgi:hypothetical protein